ncbi:MAG TPA: hypothetical protein DDY14_07290 [Chromatiaceae bacterium]|nr:MAG: hypothetical protein N838_19950 [Thiohalocapsa sp. PB-PSB1]HBG95118.1 hypothetical protein [Chromatiaceae bacterium]
MRECVITIQETRGVSTSIRFRFQAEARKRFTLSIITGIERMEESGIYIRAFLNPVVWMLNPVAGTAKLVKPFRTIDADDG